MGKEATQTYKVDIKRTHNFNTRGKMYSPELLEKIGEIVKDMAYFFGYAKTEEDKESKTGFFEYASHSPENLQRYMGFKDQNKSMVDWICTMSEEE